MLENRWLRRIMGVLTVLLVIGMGAGFCLEDASQKKQSEWMAALKEEARPYEREIDRLQSEVNEKRKAIGVTDTRPEVMLLLQIQNTGQLSRAEEWLNGYAFPVTIVLSASMKDSDIKDVFQKVKDSRYFTGNRVDVMLSGNPSEADMMRRAQRKRKLFSGYDVEFSNCWFLDRGEENAVNTELLAQNKFAGYSQLTDYGINLRSGELENGLVYTEHVPVKTGDNKIESTLKLCAEQKKAAAISFDMEMLAGLDKTEADTLADTVLSLIQTKQESQAVTVHNTSQMLSQNTAGRQSREEQQAEYDRFAAAQQEKMEELQDKVDAIYSRWEDWKK